MTLIPLISLRASTEIKSYLDYGGNDGRTDWLAYGFDDSLWQPPVFGGRNAGDEPYPDGAEGINAPGASWGHWHYFRHKFVILSGDVPSLPDPLQIVTSADDHAYYYLDGTLLGETLYGNWHHPIAVPSLVAGNHILCVKNDGGMLYGAYATWSFVQSGGLAARLAFKLVIS